MITVVGVRFKKAGKIYYFEPQNFILEKKQAVIVETSRGIEYGIVEIPNKEIPKSEIEFVLKPIIRVATKEDDTTYQEHKKKQENASKIFIEKSKKHNLNMKLIDTELTFDLNKIIFHFTAEGRIDFRNLVKELASIFKMRIELRQIGVRDEAKILGGIGICGRKLCCSSFLGEFQSVSIKMAKDQNLSLNPSKISGICGRLMCCLKYEQEAYEELTKNLPREGDIIETERGTGEVLSINILRQTIKASVKKNAKDQLKIEFFNASEVKIIKKVTLKDDENYSDELKGMNNE